jgi:dihydrofolate reductase
MRFAAALSGRLQMGSPSERVNQRSGSRRLVERVVRGRSWTDEKKRVAILQLRVRHARQKKSMSAARTRLWIASSADGYIADADGGVAWLDAFNKRDPEGLQAAYRAFIADVGSIIIGRRSYDVARSFGEWPYGDKPTFVLSSRTIDALPPGVRVWNGNLARLIATAKAAAPGDVWIDGGGVAIAHLLDAGLIDEIEVLTLPILLGGGTRLFPPRAGPPIALDLIDTRTGILGGAWMHFRVTGTSRAA